MNLFPRVSPERKEKTSIAPFSSLTQNEGHAPWYRGLTLICITAFLLLQKGMKSSYLEWPLSTSPQLEKVEFAQEGQVHISEGTFCLYTGEKKPKKRQIKIPNPLTKKSSSHLCSILTPHPGFPFICMTLWSSRNEFSLH